MIFSIFQKVLVKSGAVAITTWTAGMSLLPKHHSLCLEKIQQEMKCEILIFTPLSMMTSM